MPKHSPGIDYLSGAFFLGWAAVGWFAYLGNERLRASLFASADPGPALLPLIALSLLSVGGATALATGVVRSRREAPHAAWERLPPWRDHLAPVAFGASVVLLVFLMSRIGLPGGGLLAVRDMALRPFGRAGGSPRVTPSSPSWRRRRWSPPSTASSPIC